MTDKQRRRISHEVTQLLWFHLPRDPEHADRVQTGWGTKTIAGLVACIERIMADEA